MTNAKSVRLPMSSNQVPILHGGTSLTNATAYRSIVGAFQSYPLQDRMLHLLSTIFLNSGTNQLPGIGPQSKGSCDICMTQFVMIYLLKKAHH